jgi:hypothetical protein
MGVLHTLFFPRDIVRLFRDIVSFFEILALLGSTAILLRLLWERRSSSSSACKTATKEIPQ